MKLYLWIESHVNTILLCSFFIVDISKTVDVKATEMYKLIWVFTAHPDHMIFRVSVKSSIFLKRIRAFSVYSSHPNSFA